MADVSRFETASDIINTVAVECGLNSTTSPFSSDDPAIKQLIKLLTVCGRSLATLPAWNSSIRTHSFLTTTATTYDLPTDFLSMADATMRNSSNSQSIYGSASPQVWTIWLNENPSVTFRALFRLAARKLEIPSGAVPSGTTLSFEYRSRAWVQSADSTTTFKDKVEKNGDVVLFEPILISRMLRWKFLSARGFDTTEALIEFNSILDSVKSTDKPAEILDASRRIVGSRFLDIDNVPDTGLG